MSVMIYIFAMQFELSFLTRNSLTSACTMSV